MLFKDFLIIINRLAKNWKSRKPSAAMITRLNECFYTVTTCTVGIRKLMLPFLCNNPMKKNQSVDVYTE